MSFVKISRMSRSENKYTMLLSSQHAKNFLHFFIRYVPNKRTLLNVSGCGDGVTCGYRGAYMFTEAGWQCTEHMSIFIHCLVFLTVLYFSNSTNDLE